VILIDTSFFFPLFNQSDPDHGRVRAALQDFRGQRPRDLLLTTNHIIFETVTLARSRVDHAVAVRVSQALLSETVATIHWVGR
jgi:predicted nucleic acid-binding protein